MRKIRRPKSRKLITWMITDAVSATKSPPMTSNKRSKFINRQSAPSPVPIASEPVSPMMMRAGAHHHGRHGLARDRHRTRRALSVDELGSFVARHRRTLRRRNGIGDHPGDQFSTFRSTDFSHRALPSPLGNARLARVHDHCSIVDRRGASRNARTRYLLRRLLEDRQGGVNVAIRQRDLRTETRPKRVVPTTPVKRRGLFQPMPRGVASGRVLLLITTLLVTFGTIAVASASEGQASANGGSTWSIMIHDLVYLGFGIFALYLASRVRLNRLVRAAPLLVVVGLALLVAVRAIGVT